MHVSQVEEDGRTIIKWSRYGEREWHTDKSHYPYFYVDASEGYTLPEGIDGSVDRNPGVRAYDGTELHKVVLDSTYDMRGDDGARRAADNHFEADIPYERRYYVDEVEGSMVGEGDIEDTEPHIVHLDIEVGSDGAMPDAIEAGAPVVSVAGYSVKHDRRFNLLLKPDGWDPDTRVDEKNREYVLPDRMVEEYGEDDGKVFVFDDEAVMLAGLGRLIRNAGVEVLTGWNFNEFDAAYLISRMDRLDACDPGELSPLGESYTSEWYTEDGERNIKSVIKGVDVFDMYDAYRRKKRRDNPPNWKLATVADHEDLEVEKMDFDTARMLREWREDPVGAMHYNARDAELTHFIDQEVGIFEQFLVFHRDLAVPLRDTLHNSVMVEMFVMSRSPHWDIPNDEIILDSKRSQTNDFEGGNTRQPVPGVYDWVFSVDVTSEYPNWVRAANLSPETVLLSDDPRFGRPENIKTPIDGIEFLPHDERLGILPRAVDEMFDLKARYTEQRSQHEPGSEGYERADSSRTTSKELLNSIQGVSGMETHRLSKNEVAASITALGRETVEYMVGVGEDAGFDFVYGDTDSTFFRSDEVDCLEKAVTATKSVTHRVNNGIGDWAEETYNVPRDRAVHLEVEPDKVAARAFFPNKKKRYTLVEAWKEGVEYDGKHPLGKITHTGWAIVRSDTSRVEHRVQKKTLEALMFGKGEEYITERLKEEMRMVVEGEHGPADLARPQGSSKRFEMYGDNEGTLDFENVPYFVAAMVSSNRLLGTDYTGGDKSMMLPVEETESVTVNGSTNVVNYLAIDEDTELPDWVRMDYSKLLDNVTGKVERVYESLGWDLDELKRHKGDLLEEVGVRRTQETNHTLGAFSS